MVQTRFAVRGSRVRSRGVVNTMRRPSPSQVEDEIIEKRRRAGAAVPVSADQQPRVVRRPRRLQLPRRVARAAGGWLVERDPYDFALSRDVDDGKVLAVHGAGDTISTSETARRHRFMSTPESRRYGRSGPVARVVTTRA